MDIRCTTVNNQTHLEVNSIHGMLWLQTHFKSKHWEALASDQVTLEQSNANMLSQDAKEAGLIINSVPDIAYSK